MCDRTPQAARTDIYLGGGSELATIESSMKHLGAAWSTIDPRPRVAWGKFRELLPLIISTTISLARHGTL